MSRNLKTLAAIEDATRERLTSRYGVRLPVSGPGFPRGNVQTSLALGLQTVKRENR